MASTIETKTAGSMSVLGKDGDSEIKWNRDNPAEVAMARETFEKMTREHKYAAFRVNPSGAKGEQIRSFDPQAERILLVPPVVGG